MGNPDALAALTEKRAQVRQEALRQEQVGAAAQGAGMAAGHTTAKVAQAAGAGGGPFLGAALGEAGGALTGGIEAFQRKDSKDFVERVSGAPQAPGMRALAEGTESDKETGFAIGQILDPMVTNLFAPLMKPDDPYSGVDAARSGAALAAAGASSGRSMSTRGLRTQGEPQSTVRFDDLSEEDKALALALIRGQGGA